MAELFIGHLHIKRTSTINVWLIPLCSKLQVAAREQLRESSIASLALAMAAFLLPRDTQIEQCGWKIDRKAVKQRWKKPDSERQAHLCGGKVLWQLCSSVQVCVDGVDINC